MAEQMIDQLRKDNDNVIENLERKRNKNMADLQVCFFKLIYTFYA